MSSTTATRNKAVIQQQRIVWWLNGDGAPTELDEASIEHIARHIKDDYREGELCVTGADSEVVHRGWWQLDQGTDDATDGTLTHDEVIAKIAEALRGVGADVLVEVYGQYCDGDITYLGDSTYQLT